MGAAWWDKICFSLPYCYNDMVLSHLDTCCGSATDCLLYIYMSISYVHRWEYLYVHREIDSNPHGRKELLTISAVFMECYLLTYLQNYLS